MKKILNHLKKANGITLNHRKLKLSILEIKNAFKPFQIEFKIKDEKDYFESCIHYQGLLNKQKFEQLYEKERNDMFDIWDNLSYQERNKLIQLKLDFIKEECPYFKTYEDKIIWIPFFDTLLNGLYNSDLAILELSQYFKLYKDFKDRRVNIRDYQFLPYTNKFIDVTPILETEEVIYFYSQTFMSIFELTEQFEMKRIPLDKDLCKIQPFKKDLLALVHAYRKDDINLFLSACIESILISEKTKKEFIKRIGKKA